MLPAVNAILPMTTVFQITIIKKKNHKNKDKAIRPISTSAPILCWLSEGFL